jgi:hypothetical protein
MMITCALLRAADAKLPETIGKVPQYRFIIVLCRRPRLFEGETADQKTKTYEKKYNSSITNKDVWFLDRKTPQVKLLFPTLN